MLTHTQIRNLRPREKTYRKADGHGLTIEIKPDGSLFWRFRYRYRGKANMLSFGKYPELSLPEARSRRDEARRVLAEGCDPSAERQARRQAAVQTQATRFEAVARAWMAEQDVSEATTQKTRWLLETYAFPRLGERPLGDIRARELLEVLEKVEAEGKLETAQRLRQKFGQIFRHAVTRGLVEHDPTASLRGSLKAPKPRHRSAITEPRKIGELMRAIEGFEGHPVTVFSNP